MYVRNLDEQQYPVRESPCIHLRSKALYVTGQVQNPDHPEDAGSPCWCNLTQHIIGPDQRHVDIRACINGRGCFRETY